MARKDSIKKLKVVLIQRREALIKALAGDNSLLNEMSKQTSGDVIDFALDTVSDEIHSRLAEAESKELAHIQYAMEKLEEGTYGKCEACNCSIPLARLQALPYAILCINCKRNVENGSLTPSSNGGWITPGESDDISHGDVDSTLS